MAALTLFLALLLAVSALHKLADRPRAATSAARMAGAPAQLGLPLACVAAALEACAALALLVPDARLPGAAIAGLVWLAYGIALARLQGRTLDCGCDFTAREKPVDGFMIGRPFLLVALAGLVMMLPVAPHDPVAPFAALGLLALWFAAGELATARHLPRGATR